MARRTGAARSVLATRVGSRERTIPLTRRRARWRCRDSHSQEREKETSNTRDCMRPKSSWAGPHTPNSQSSAHSANQPQPTACIRSGELLHSSVALVGRRAAGMSASTVRSELLEPESEDATASLVGGLATTSLAYDSTTPSSAPVPWVPVSFVSRSPGSRVFPSAVVHSGSLYVFGGHDGGVYRNDLLIFNLETRAWQLDLDLSTGGPSPRDAHAAVVHHEWMYVFGGYDSKRYLNDFHRFHFESAAWSVVSFGGAAPSPRGGHTAVVYADEMLVFGGCDGWNYFNDLFKYAFGAEQWVPVRVTGSCPGARSAPATVVHAASAHMYVFGGYDGGRSLNDLFRLDLNSNDWAQVRPPAGSDPACQRATMPPAPPPCDPMAAAMRCRRRRKHVPMRILQPLRIHVHVHVHSRCRAMAAPHFWGPSEPPGRPHRRRTRRRDVRVRRQVRPLALQRCVRPQTAPSRGRCLLPALAPPTTPALPLPPLPLDSGCAPAPGREWVMRGVSIHAVSGLCAGCPFTP